MRNEDIKRLDYIFKPIQTKLRPSSDMNIKSIDDELNQILI